MTQRIITYANWYLEEWGLWAMDSKGININFSKCTSFDKYIIKKNRHTQRSSVITDEEARLVDSAVSSLILTDEEAHSVLVQYYLLQFSRLKIQKNLNLYWNKVQVILSCGIAWVGAFLYQNSHLLVSKNICFTEIC